MSQCAERVFTGERWDMGGHMCQKKATYHEDGKDWCYLHAPSQKAAKRRLQDEADRRRRERREAEEMTAHETVKRLSEKLGIAVHASTTQYGSRIYVISKPYEVLKEEA